MPSQTDRIEKQVVIRAPRERVWKAITTAKEFGAWFGVALSDVAFAPGANVHGQITHPGYTHLKWEVTIETMEAPRLFSFRWVPYTPEAAPTGEPSTLVTFELEETATGTLVRVTESGFDAVPIGRRARAFEGNTRGWEAQMENIRKYVEQNQ